MRWRWVVWCAWLALGGARAQRFGDRLAPRVPASLAPRHAPSYDDADAAAPHYHDDGADEHADIDDGEFVEDVPTVPTIPDDDASSKPATDGINSAPALRRPTRTEAHRLEMSTEFFIVPEKLTTAPPSPPTTSRSTSTTEAPSTSAPTPLKPSSALRSEPWAVPVLALSCAFMLALAAFEGFVVWGARNTAPSRRHLMLGQTLLLGLFACSATAALFTATPSTFSCGAVRFGTGTAYVIVYASLLVKCVFLLSLNGGVYLPASYQALLLFFAVMIQVAIGTQWVGGRPPRVVAGACGAPFADLLLSLSYAAFLIALVCGVALRSRGIRDNYREATHIAGAAGGSAALWVCWVGAALGAGERHRDACMAAGLLGCTALVFALMFAPKGRRLAALGQQGRYDSDRDEGLSSLGRAPSGYSPSFFHFKPVKYGMVTGAPPPPLPSPPEHLKDRKEPPVQPADMYVGMMGYGAHRPSFPPLYPLPLHHPPPFHYHYTPYHYLLPPGMVVRAEDGNVYTSAEPTFSSNPNVFFQRTDGMMY